VALMQGRASDRYGTALVQVVLGVEFQCIVDWRSCAGKIINSIY